MHWQKRKIDLPFITPSLKAPTENLAHLFAHFFGIRVDDSTFFYGDR
jgi:hypothetical protein